MPRARITTPRRDARSVCYLDIILDLSFRCGEPIIALHVVIVLVALCFNKDFNKETTLCCQPFQICQRDDCDNLSTKKYQQTVYYDVQLTITTVKTGTMY